MQHCLFCAILAGESPASIVAEDRSTLAFMDLRQGVPGHVLIVPRRHVRDIYELDAEDGAAVMRMAILVAKAVRAAFDPPGLNFWQSNGEVAGQEIWHFHLHVAPRREGDGLLRAYTTEPPAPSQRSELDALAGTLRHHLQPTTP